jgi:hypothetical protein
MDSLPVRTGTNKATAVPVPRVEFDMFFNM